MYKRQEWYRVSKEPELQEDLKLLEECYRFDEPVFIPGADDTFVKLAQTLRIYNPPLDGELAKDRDQNYLIGIWNALETLLKKPALDVAKDAFDDIIARYFRRAAARQHKDTLRKEPVGHEIPYADLSILPDAKDKSSLGDIPESMSETNVWELLGLSPSELDPQEGQLLEEVYDALRHGYSLRQYWPKEEYERKKKSWQRLRKKLREILPKSLLS